MVTASGSLRIGPAEYASHIALERTFRVFTVERRGTLWDSRFVRGPEQGMPTATVIYLLLDGWIRLHAGGELKAPFAFRATSQIVDGGGRSSITITNGGEPYRALQIAITDDLSPPTEIVPLPISEAVAAAAREVNTSPADGVKDAIARMFVRLSGEGILEPDFDKRIVVDESASTIRLWSVLSTFYLQIRTTPTMQELCNATNLSMRQCAREVDKLCSTFGVQWRGLRGASSDLRRRWAILLLSVPSLPITEIARATGYGSVDALGRAFRDIELPSPSGIREQMLAQVAGPASG